jgi:hypothetical protein
LALRIRGQSLSTLRYSIRQLNFIQSSMSGAQTLLFENAIIIMTSGLACLLTYKVIVTRLWNAIASSSLRFVACLLMMNKSLGAAPVLATFFFFATALKLSL